MEIGYDTMVTVDHSYYLQNWFAVYIEIVRWLVEAYVSITISLLGFSSFWII